METDLLYKYGNMAKEVVKTMTKHVRIPKDASLNAELVTKRLHFFKQTLLHTFFFLNFVFFL